MGEGEGGMFQENSIEACMVPRVKQITSPGWMHETSERSDLVHWENLGGAGGVGGGRGDRDGEQKRKRKRKKKEKKS